MRVGDIKPEDLEIWSTWSTWTVHLHATGESTAGATPEIAFRIQQVQLKEKPHRQK